MCEYGQTRLLRHGKVLCVVKMSVVITDEYNFLVYSEDLIGRLQMKCDGTR